MSDGSITFREVESNLRCTPGITLKRVTGSMFAAKRLDYTIRRKIAAVASRWRHCADLAAWESNPRPPAPIKMSTTCLVTILLMQRQVDYG